MKIPIVLLSVVCILLNCCSSNDDQPNCVQKLWFRDVDGDGFGDPANTQVSCEQPEGFVGVMAAKDVPTDTINQNPEITSGVQEIFLIQETSANYGFVLYTPSEYTKDTSETFPLLIYLHGGGGRGLGNSKSSFDRVIFDITPPGLIANNKWAPPAPMVVASPQSPSLWDPDALHQFIGYLIETMNIDTSRIYMTGLSMGARGTFDYITAYGDRAYTAAAVPIAGWSLTNNGVPFKNIPLWAFHGSADNIINVSGSINMVNAINSSNPATKAKLTIFPGVNHASWVKVYNNSGTGTGDPNYDPYNTNIYDWMLQFKKE